jgi:uncharacterized protein (DUF1684 family)
MEFWMSETNYFSEMNTWQATMNEQLRAKDGWLTLVGLYWLQMGDNKIGSNPNHPIPLPAGTPDTVGTLTLIGEKVVILETSPNVSVMIGEKKITGKIELESDINRNPTIVHLGSVSFYIVIRGVRTGVRVKQADSPLRLNFPGRVWWPVDEEMRVTARINNYEPQKLVDIPDVLGNVNETAMDCALEFELEGKTFQLDAMGLPSGQFYILFHDKSCSNGSYPSGRFLVSEYPEEDSVVVDFNKAHNPPCAFTNFATCPLPPSQNYLQIPVQAGERYIKLTDHE